MSSPWSSRPRWLWKAIWLTEKLWNLFKLDFLSDVEGIILRVCARVCLCALCVFVHTARQYDTGQERLGNGLNSQKQSASSAQCLLHLSIRLSTLAHAHTHSITHSCEPIHPSPWHDCSSLVTLCSNPSALSKTAITPSHRCSEQTESELWHGALLQIAIKVPFFLLEQGEQVESNGHS